MRSLIDEITHSVVGPAARKSFLKAPYVPFQRYLGCYQEAFEIGAVLGYSFRDRITTFAKLFSEADRDQELIKFMSGLAQDRLKGVDGAKSFVDVAMFAEEARIKANWRNSGLTVEQIAHLEKHHEISFEQAFKNLYVAASTGIGFGRSFPELTERWWKEEHERHVTAEEWAKWRKAGLDIPNEPEEPVTLTGRQKELLSQVEIFVSKARPELLSEFKAALQT